MDLRFLLKRVIMVIPVAIGICFIVFLMLHLAPGDPVLLLAGPRASPEVQERIRTELGLDKPLYIQFLIFFNNIFFKGNFGRSIITKQDVLTLIWAKLPQTLELTLAGLIISYLIQIPLGVIAALKHNTWVDRLIMGAVVFGYAIPTFWLGIMLMLIFSATLHLLPIGGTGGIGYLILPALTLGLSEAALTARTMRSSMLEIIHQDYITYLKAKGLPNRSVIYKHALRNALIPIVTLLGLRIGWLIGGAVVIEGVFARSGIGSLLIQAIYQRDYPVVQGVMFILAISVILGNLISDILYTVVDPRITQR